MRNGKENKSDKPKPEESPQKKQQKKPSKTKRLRELSKLLAEKNNDEAIKNYLEYTRHITNLDKLSKLVALYANSSAKEKQLETIDEIMFSTKEYYTFLSILTDKNREFLLLLTELATGSVAEKKEVKSAIGIIGGGEVPPALVRNSFPLIVRSISPKKYVMQMDAVSNKLYKEELKEESVEILTRIRQSKNPVRTTIALTIPKHMKIEGGGTLSTYDRAILNGITSLLESGNSAFTIPMLYHAMTGKETPSISEILWEDLVIRIERMRRIIISIDVSEEIEHNMIFGDARVNQLEISGYLLPLNKITGIINNNKAEIYQIIQNPPVYSYAKIKKQLSSVPIKLLDAPINNNSTTIPLKTYLLQRIELMKNKKNKIKATLILFKSVYEELGMEEADRNAKKRVRDYSIKILQHFADKNYISSFETVKCGKSISGVHINIPF
jgi:hypothetical protein